MFNKNNLINNFLYNSKVKFKHNKNVRNEVDYYINRVSNSEIGNTFNKIIKKLKVIKKISNNVILVKNLDKVYEEFSDKKYLFFVNRISKRSFNKIYPGFVKNKKFIFYENIKKGIHLKEIINKIKKNKFKLVCIGGGKITDLAKYISYKSKSNLITIPTILATHVYASKKIHVLKPIRDLGHDLTINGKASDLSIIDLKTINLNYSIDKKYILSGMGDIMAFYNSQLDWRLSPKFEIKKFSFALKVIKKVENILENIDLEKPIKDWIGKYIYAQVLLCELTDWVGSASASGAEHFFANIYEKKYPGKILHGELVAFGTLLFIYMRKKNFNKILLLMKKFKIKNSLKKLNISKNRIINSLMECKKEGIKKKRYSIIDKLKFDNEYITNLINDMIKKKIIRP